MLIYIVFWGVVMGKFEKKRVRSNVNRWPLLIAILLLLVVIAVIVVVTLGGGNDGSQDKADAGQTQNVISTSPGETSLGHDTTGDPATEQVSESMKRLEVQSIEEAGECVIVHTSYAELAFPFAFGDMIRIAADNQDDYAVLRFFVCLGDGQYPIFNLVFNAESVFRLGTIYLDDAMPSAMVSAEFCDPDASIDQANMSSFYAAQEVFNDIVTSLEQNKTFTPAD